MKGKDIYKIWAKENSKWANWIRPVPFVGINENMKIYEISDFVSKINGTDKKDYKLTAGESILMSEFIERFMNKRLNTGE